MNEFQQKYAKEIKDVLAKYPDDQKRSAVMPLLYIAQRDMGYVSKKELQEIGEVIDITATEVASIVGFYTLYHDKPEGKYRIQVCNDLPCALRGSEEYFDDLCEALDLDETGGTIEDGIVTVEAVMCLAACDKAPMFQEQSYDGIKYHEDQTVESTLKLVESWRKKEAKKQ